MIRMQLVRRSALAAMLAAPLASLLLAATTRAQDAAPYYPPRGEWAKRRPDQVGMNAERLDEAVLYALDHEASTPTDLEEYIATTLANEPHGEIVGPIKNRGPMSGLILRHGYLVAEWGEPERVDMTFSVTKTYLSTTVGLAYDRGLIPDVHARVHELVPTEHFEGEHNGAITWDHLLRQTSDWRGTLFEKPDWADRPPRGLSLEELPNQPVKAPGTSWKYNDVRVNLLALAALEVWREPLPVVLRRKLMDPIGASSSWRWHGYETSWVTLDGQRMQSVSGGGHWGGGFQISSFDHARFGYLFLRQGRWKDVQLISEEWIAMARTPTEPNPSYGYMNWFLNGPVPGRGGTATKPMPSAPETSVTFRGAGSNIVYVDWENDLVVVVRWIDRNLDGFIGKLLAALEED